MNMYLDDLVAQDYSSPSQKSRIITENWVAKNLYCPICGNQTLSQYTSNKPVADFFCTQCEEDFELKAKKKFSHSSQDKITDGAYATMIERITSLRNPHLLYMKYYETQVMDLLMIPKFFFVPDIIEMRNPLSHKARRAGWIGCNINITNVPDAGRIGIIINKTPKEPRQVADEYYKASLLKTDNIENRGWLLDVLRCIERLPVEFALRDVYTFTEFLSVLHPNNNNVKAKIRQQMQILRDKGLISFTSIGVYRKV